MKKIFKVNKSKTSKLVAVFTTMLFFINSLGSTAQALVMNSQELNMNMYFRDTQLKTKYYVAEIKDKDGNDVYCLNANKFEPEGQDLEQIGVLNDKVYTVLKNGYPNKSFTGNATKDRMITQMALWGVYDTANINDINNIVAIVNEVEDTQMTKYVKDLYNTAINNTEKQDVKINFSKTNLTATLENDKYVTPYFKINSSGNIGNGVTVKIDVLQDMINSRVANNISMDGIIIQNKSGQTLTDIPLNTEIRLVIPKRTDITSLTFRAEQNIKITQAVQYECKTDSQIQNVAKYGLFDKYIKSTSDLVVSWEEENIKGGVCLTKIADGDEKKFLPGAVFELYKADTNELIKQYTTDENGQIEIIPLDGGKYYFKEIKAPDGYALDADKKYEFEIKTDNEFIELTVTNKEAEGEVHFSKTDLVTGEIGEGAKIEIVGLDEENKDVKIEFISSKEGNIIKLPLGKYEFRETIAPTGYVQTTEVGTFEITAHGAIVKAELKNKPILGTVEILKVDSQNKEKVLEGAVFTIYNEQGQEVTKGTTDKEGKLKFENLPYGKYTLKETKAPIGYKLNESAIEFSIDEDGKVLSYQVQNEVNRLIQTGGFVSNGIFIAVGAALLVTGGVYIFKKKDKTNEAKEEK